MSNSEKPWIYKYIKLIYSHTINIFVYNVQYSTNNTNYTRFYFIILAIQFVCYLNRELISINAILIII